jgi:hypothetical protein
MVALISSIYLVRGGFWFVLSLVDFVVNELFDFKITALHLLNINLACLSVCLFVSNKRQNG